ncbi:uncharacterized protein LOC106942119 isoform X2 [Poecilia latipinna]|uniref:uncharacterized protein LOC106942119 isoform X2 n=1 Tax=Poecilia latipinna TaxID=48699 RepID=UPI00072ED650|nr:PREDICTED: uncharacterized protein LOC106942119 isoform X2 [Poecilia latipinna]
METSSAPMDNLGARGTQTQNRNYDEGMDDMEDISSEHSKGCKSDGSSKWSGLNAASSRSTESRNSSSRKPEQLNQTTNRWSLPSIPSISSIFKSPTPVVKVHYTPTSDTFGADAAIMKQLQNNLKSSMQLVETTKNCSVIIVVCPVIRSFESEIRSAMEKEAVSSSGKPFILVLMHHTRDPDYSTAGCDCLEMLKNVFYVHVFYHETEKGLLRCNQNAMAIKDIEKNLQTYEQ